MGAAYSERPVRQEQRGGFRAERGRLGARDGDGGAVERGGDRERQLDRDVHHDRREGAASGVVMDVGEKAVAGPLVPVRSG